MWTSDAFACPDNVFFFEPLDWIWGLVVWQGMQILLLFAQERFGPAFLCVAPPSLLITRSRSAAACRKA